MEIFYYAKPRIYFVEQELGWFPIFDRLDFINAILENESQEKSSSKIFVLPIASKSDVREFENCFQNNSVLIYLYADETYSCSLTYSVLSLSGVRAILRPYSLGTSDFLKMLGNLVESLIMIQKQPANLLSRIKSLAWFSIGLIILFRIFCLRFLHYWKDIPEIRGVLGYTNLFANCLENKLMLPKGCSLLFSDVVSEAIAQERHGFIFFAGQTGKYPRKLAIQELEVLAQKYEGVRDVRIIKRDSFGGGSYESLLMKNNADIYIQLGLSFEFCLTPPGNYSWKTFRFMESIILGSLPIMSVPSICDPVDFNFPNSRTCTFLPWTAIFEEAQRMPPKTRKAELNYLKSGLQEEVRLMNERIKLLQE